MTMTDNVPVALFRPMQWEEAPVDLGKFQLPTGTVTLLLGDVEGSTRRWESDPDWTGAAMVNLSEVVDEWVGRCDGVRPVEQGEGDSFVAAFARARDGVACALAIQRALVDGPLRVRMGIHAGDVQRRDEGNYVGAAIHRTARLRTLANGGQTVLSQTAVDLVIEALPDSASVFDLGVHRLKDLSRPEHVYQLCHPDLPAEFPPLRSLDPRRHNLPVQRTTLIGRREEMERVKGLLAEAPLVTLTGSGGVGKTRLAVQTGAELVDDYSDGVWLADLAAVTDPGAVGSQVASMFALKEAPGMSAEDTLAAYLADQQVLVVLDNCEHVLDAAATLADTLLVACPRLRVLATSRQPLSLPGEVTWRVPSLEVPTDDEAAGIVGVRACEAVALFAERAARSMPGFAVTDTNATAVADICRRLDGIPLAIELAAARIRVFTPAQIAEGLDRRFGLLTGAPRTALPRQQTLRASVDWSHDLLTHIEQVLLRRLSVFAGGFDYVAAQAVAACYPIEAHQVLDLLGLLVDKSLVQVDHDGEQARYRLLETIRQYAGERLEEAAELGEVRDRHRDHYLALAEEAARYLQGAEQRPWLARLTLEYPNLRGALTWSRDREEWNRLGRLAASLSTLWYTAGPNQEGEAWLDAALDHAADLPSVLRCQMLYGRGLVAAGNFDAGVLAQRSEEGVALARDLGEPGLLSRLLSGAGMAAVLTGQPTPALQEAIVLARDAGDAFALATALEVQGISYLTTDPPRARPYLEESARVADGAGDSASAHLAEANLSCVLWWLGEPRESARRASSVCAEAAEFGDRVNLGASLFYQGMALAEADERTDAMDVAERLAVVSRRSAMRLWETYVPLIRSHLALSAADAHEAMHQADSAAHLAYIPLTRANILPCLIEAEVAVGRTADAASHAGELVELSKLAGFAYYLAWGLMLQARLHRLEMKADAAENIAHEALVTAAGIEAKARIVDTLELLAGIANDIESTEEAVRLFGAAAAIRDRTGYLRCVSERDADMARARQALGPDRFQAYFDQGQALNTGDAIAYARRGRGERKRPSTGWASLTPTEMKVVEQVSQGLSNAEIAERLFCSPRTVQAHLTHVFAKLGVTSRTELAAHAAQHRA
jgi:predicted ATPase/class 3 adenylate cyclase/DNA-binding CsgD family transcriptional regulator